MIPIMAAAPRVTLAQDPVNEACQHSAAELVNIIVVQQLSFHDYLLVLLTIIILVCKDNQKARSGTWHDRVHNHYVRPKNVVSHFGWSSIHKQACDQNEQGARDEEVDVLVRELPVLILSNELEYH